MVVNPSLLISPVVSWLSELDSELTAQEIAEIFWLALQLNQQDFTVATIETLQRPRSSEAVRISEEIEYLPESVDNLNEESDFDDSYRLFNDAINSGAFNPSSTVPFKVPEASALGNSLEIARALHPLQQKFPSQTQNVLDEEATVDRIVDEKLWAPVLKMEPERWLSLTLVVEQTPTVAIWKRAITEWQRLVSYHGAFQNVHIWSLKEKGEQEWNLFSGNSTHASQYKFCTPRALIKSGRRHLIVLISDCVSASWQNGHIFSLLMDWSAHNSVSLLQLMPEQYWSRTVLGRGRFAQLSSLSPGSLNKQLVVSKVSDWEEPITLDHTLKLPVITFEPDSLHKWAQVTTGNGRAFTAGVVFESVQAMTHLRQSQNLKNLTASERVKSFRTTASRLARRLAGLMATVPVSLPVMRLIQQTMLPQSSQIHLAEIFLGGLLILPVSENKNSDPEKIEYKFWPGVREILLQTTPISDADEVLDIVSNYIAKKAGYSIRSFDALLEIYPKADLETREHIQSFAKVTPEVLRRLGGLYIDLLDEFQATWREKQNNEVASLDEFQAIPNTEQSVAQRQWLAKLSVIGEGGAGKTSLIRSLQSGFFESQQSSTHGIDIDTLNLTHPTEKNVTITLNTWNFGGRQIYHATHQFFLTNRSIFLLVFNARSGPEQGRLTYWLKSIRANAPESPIILVATHIDKHSANLALSELRQLFPQIVAFHEVSSKTRNGIQELRLAIAHAAAELPTMGEVWPATWLAFANAVRQSAAKYATSKQFWEVMADYKISRDNQVTLAKWLHEIGDILFFQDENDVNDFVILKPQWVTEYIHLVLESEEVTEHNGIFTRECMDRVWSNLRPNLRNFFLRLMEQFDLSYRILGDRNISLVVERLPYELPDYVYLWQQKQKESNCKEVSMKFQVSEILPGIPTWFIARQHRFIKHSFAWRTGALFSDHEEKHLGLVRVSRDATNADCLHLAVRGPVPHNFFDVLREGLELTLHRYPGLKITRLLPCPDPTQINCLHEFDYANLTMRLERTPPKESIECPNCLENISVTQLLFGLHYTTNNNVIAEIEKLQAFTQEGFDTLQDAMAEEFTELRELVQRDVIREIRVVQKHNESPCPGVFVLRPDDRKLWQKDIGSQRINLQLYCEHPGCLHPVKDGGLYSIDNPAKLLKLMTPHMNRIFGILKYVTPVMGPWVNLSSPIYSELIKNDLALTKALIDKLPEIKFDGDDRNFIDDERGTHRVNGAALRSLHEFLKKKDPEQVWGGLTRITTPEGDVLWLCKEHIKEIYPTSS